MIFEISPQNYSYFTIVVAVIATKSCGNCDYYDGIRDLDLLNSIIFCTFASYFKSYNAL